MIFVVLGTQKFQCNRLLQEIDKLIEEGKITEPVFAQIGHSDYIPKNYMYTNFVQKEEFEDKISACNLLITHSGVGTILNGINLKKPIIVFPRLKKYREHVDDHQLDIARAFSKKKLVLMCGENDSLDKLIKESHSFEFGTYVANQGKVVEVINAFIKKEIEDV